MPSFAKSHESSDIPCFGGGGKAMSEPWVCANFRRVVEKRGDSFLYVECIF